MVYRMGSSVRIFVGHYTTSRLAWDAVDIDHSLRIARKSLYVGPHSMGWDDGGVLVFGPEAVLSLWVFDGLCGIFLGLFF